ncbi:hypothetical protein BHM03_00026477 [Ensete ventricosum]|uniref:Cyclin-dependent kinase inhibitor domain-containing protein n=1 Tax=Ensete ventricosum TaxID=4639 RepID=A0A426YPG3_ENSVE|nr:hypothetical protein B296_00025238 [Ensete ventricosum]RZR97322.1 hypothetical protein BHM03_00026477 [Ensete ventricosum]
MRKAKLPGEVAVMEVAAHQPSRGVRTRARALAAAAAAAQDSSLAYLELRSRRLEKPLPLVPACKPKSNPSPKLTSQRANRSSVSNSRSAGSGRMRRCLDRGEGASPCVQVSFGENFLESESRERYNYDPVNDHPLRGRYEWVEIDS